MEVPMVDAHILPLPADWWLADSAAQSGQDADTAQPPPPPPPVHLPSAEIARLQRIAQMPPKDIADLAWDMVLYNDMDRTQIMSSYGLNMDDVVEIQQIPLYKAEAENAAKALKADPHIAARRIAKGFMMHRISTLNEMATSTMVEAAVRLKAIGMLADIAGVADPVDKEKKNMGVAVQINMGTGVFDMSPSQEARVFVAST
jgi:hypothetical protein